MEGEVNLSLHELKVFLKNMKYLNLIESIKNKKNLGVVPVIAEIKRLTPRLEKKIKKDTRDAGLLAKLYQKAGAAGISLITEKKYFGGQPEIDIPKILESVNLPLLIKDFIRDEQTVNYYLNLVSKINKNYLQRISLLLIVHHLQKTKLQKLIKLINKKGALVQIEIMEKENLSVFKKIRPVPKLFNINNKKIKHLEKGKNKLIINKLLVQNCRKIIKDSILISSSAHQSVDDVRKSIQSGADAILAGSVFMKAKNPVKTIRSFVNAL